MEYSTKNLILIFKQFFLLIYLEERLGMKKCRQKDGGFWPLILKILSSLADAISIFGHMVPQPTGIYH